MGCGRTCGRSPWPHAFDKTLHIGPYYEERFALDHPHGWGFRPQMPRRPRGRAAIGIAMQSSPTTTRNSTVNTSARGHYAPRSFHAGVLRALDVVAEAALKSGPLDEFLSLLLRNVLENTRHVDTLGVFIQDGNGIRLSTGVGRDEEIKD